MTLFRQSLLLAAFYFMKSYLTLIMTFYHHLSDFSLFNAFVAWFIFNLKFCLTCHFWFPYHCVLILVQIFQNFSFITDFRFWILNFTNKVVQFTDMDVKIQISSWHSSEWVLSVPVANKTICISTGDTTLGGGGLRHLLLLKYLSWWSCSNTVHLDTLPGRYYFS